MTPIQLEYKFTQKYDNWNNQMIQLPQSHSIAVELAALDNINKIVNNDDKLSIAKQMLNKIL